MIVDLERINEEQSSGSAGGGTTSTPSTNPALTGGFHSSGRKGERRRRRQREEGEHPSSSPSQQGQYPQEQLLHEQQHPIPSRTANPQHLADQQFYAYRHQYYMEQYHYYCDDDNNNNHNNSTNNGMVDHGNGGNGYDEYAYDDDEYEEETIHSTCSSVTLSQAFHPSHSHHDEDGNDVSCSSSLTDEYYALHPPPLTSLPLSHEGANLDSGIGGGGSSAQLRRCTGIGRATSTISRESSGSTLSSVTLSRALGRDVDRHDHEHSFGGGGFYVATRLGDFVQQDDENVVGGGGIGGGIGNDAVVLVHPCNADESVLHTAATSRDAEKHTNKKEEVVGEAATSAINAAPDKSTILDSRSNHQHPNKYTYSTSNNEDDFEIETVLSDISVAGSYKEGGDNTNQKDNEKKINGVTTQITSALEEISSDILSSIIPECGVPIPSVMAKVGGRSRGYGMLLPWHSTRSIQNYHRGGSSKRGGKKRGGSGGSSDSSLSSGRREGNIFSMSSVHTFRG